MPQGQPIEGASGQLSVSTFIRILRYTYVLIITDVEKRLEKEIFILSGRWQKEQSHQTFAPRLGSLWRLLANLLQRSHHKMLSICCPTNAVADLVVARPVVAIPEHVATNGQKAKRSNMR